LLKSEDVGVPQAMLKTLLNKSSSLRTVINSCTRKNSNKHPTCNHQVLKPKAHGWSSSSVD